MTTLVGIKTGNGEGGVILGSDMNRTQTGWNPQGDVAYRIQRKIESPKIYIDNNRELALCMSGVFDQPYVDFLSALLEGGINFKEAIERRDFEALRNLNLFRWQGRVPDTDFMNGLLIATRFNEPKLYTCFPLGFLEERAWTSIGSGSDYALRHILESGKLIPKGIRLNDGIDLTVQALDTASQDLYTGGLDLVVVTKDGIYNMGEVIRSEVNTARTNAIDKAKIMFDERIQGREAKIFPKV